jgi:hypothetical protein
MTEEPSLTEIYCKFGEISEAAQLLETQLGTLLLLHNCVEAGLFENKDPVAAEGFLEKINRNTLGQLLRNLHGKYNDLDALESLLNVAKEERNRLIHSFYREHNFRRNSPGGRVLMLQDLEQIHEKIIDAYKAVMNLSGIDLDKLQI